MQTDKSREIPVRGSYDVVIMGGGPAGVSAAVSAARSGAKVALIESRGYLGGLATGGLVIVLCGLTYGKEQIIRGFCQEIIEEMRKLGGATGWPEVIIDPETLKYVLDKKTVESNVRLYLHSLVVDLIMDKNRIKYAIMENKSGRQAIQGKVFVDATGDGDSARWCNLEFNKGKPPLPVTLTFRMNNVKIRKAKQYLKNLEEDLGENVTFKYGGWRGTTNKGEVWFDALFLNDIDGTNVDDLTRAEITLRKYLRKALEKIKKIPGFEEASVRDSALGIRETRHIKGRYVLTRKDVNKKFYDSIARAGNFFIPLRCLLPERVDNLLLAGRCISVSADVFDLIREIPCCMATGEAAGVASALKGLPLDSIRKELLKRNAII
jgi:hypothetical protein